MFRRSALIATIQVALATSAVAGVASVFMRQGSMAGRTAGTALVVLLGAICLMPLSRPSSDGRTSALEILWSGFVCIGAVLTVGLIWPVMPAGTPRDLLLATDLAWIGYGVPTSMVLMPALRRRATPSRISYPASSRVVVIGAGICFLAAVSAHVTMEWNGSTRTEFVPFAFVISTLALVLAAANLVSFRIPRPMDRAGSIDRVVGTIGVLASAMGWAGWMCIATLSTNLLEPLGSGSMPARPHLISSFMPPSVGLTGLSISGALWCSLRAVGFRGWWAALPGIATGLTLLLCGLLTFASIEQGLPDFLQRTVIALGIMDASALVTVVLVLRARRSGPDTDDFLKPIEGLPLKCPRCSAPRMATLGESACASCGLVLLLAVRDDQCPACRYDLRGNSQTCCPECGRLRQLPDSATAV
ncbi:MAG: hypothetical protein ACOYMI_04975 [Phycisphaerales bacterium]|jgi:hypothetical protein